MNTRPRRHEEPVGHDDLAELLPAPGNPVLPQDRHAVLKEYLMRQITDESAPPKPTAGELLERPRSKRRRVTLVAAPYALAAAVTLGVVAMDDDVKKSAPVTAAQHREAARLLDRIATVAAERPAVKVTDEQYIYTRTRGAGSVLGIGDHVVRDLVQREEWHAVDGKRDGWIRVDPVEGTRPDSTERVEGPMDGVPYLTFRQLQSLPTDPDALLKKLRADTNGVESTQEEAVFEYIDTMLEEATLLPDLGAALYRAAARLPGIRVDHHTQDATGRKGIGLSYTDSSTGEHTWVFDRKTLAYLGTTKTAFLGAGVSDTVREAPSR